MSLSTGFSSTSRTSTPAPAASTAAATPAAPLPTTTTGTWRSGLGALPAMERGSASRLIVSVPATVTRRGAGHRGADGHPAGSLAPVRRRLGEAAERKRRQVGELTATVQHQVAHATAGGRREAEAHARHRGDDHVVGAGEAIDDGQSVGRVLDDAAPRADQAHVGGAGSGPR